MSLAAFVRKLMHVCARYKKILLGVCGALCAAAAFFYLRAFFTVGVDFDGAFLTKHRESGAVVYTGENAFGALRIEAARTESGAAVTYTVPYNKPHAYTVAFSPDSEFWQNVTVTDSWTDETLFDGKYQRGNAFLYDSHNRPVYGDMERSDGGNPYINFSPNLRRLVGFAAGEYEHIAGNWLCFIPGVLLILLVLFHVRFPIVTMRIERRLLGRDPMPSEARLLFHTALHLILLFLAAILLTVAV